MVRHAAAGARLGIGRGFTVNEDVAGLKIRLAGDAVYDQDSWLPQVAVGAQFKSNDAHAVLRAIGAKSAQGVDVYLAATKLFLAQSVLVNATVRLTKANQFGCWASAATAGPATSRSSRARWPIS